MLNSSRNCFDRLRHRGPTSFDLRANSHKRNNSRATSSKMMYKITDSQDLKLKRKNKCVCHWNYYTTAKNNLSFQIFISGILVTEVSLTLSFLYQCQYVSCWKSETIVQCFVWFLFLYLICFLVEGVLSHMYALPNRECIFSEKSFSLGNLFLLNNFQKLSTV